MDNISNDTIEELSWHDYLHLHPIFSYDPAIEQNSEERTASKASQKLGGKRSCLVTTSRMLFVAVGKEIRALSLSDFYFAWQQAYKDGESDQDSSQIENHARPGWMENAKHITLDTPAINFEINSLAVNFTEQGSLMAVVGVYEIAVVILPLEIQSITRMKMASKSYLVGPFYHVIGASSICKVLWHPLSCDGSHLMVLTVDGVLRMYQLFEDPNEPEQVFNVIKTSKSLNGYRCSLDDAPEAASFCFGQSSNVWGQFAIYVLMKNSDIYCFCPVIPDRSSCQFSHIERLFCLISKKYAGIFGKGKGNWAALEAHYKRQLEWISEIMRYVPENPNPDAKILITLMPSTHEYPQRQGPYLLQPSPIELSATDCPDASDILCLGTKNVNVFAIVFDNGRVDICLEDDMMEGCWKQQNDRYQQLPSLIVYECIDIGLQKTYRDIKVSDRNSFSIYPSLIADPHYSDTFYVYHVAGAHAVVISNWLEEINELLDAGLADELEEYSEKYVKSEVYCLITNDPSFDIDPLIGLCLMSNIQLGYSVFMLTFSNQFWSHKLNFRKSITHFQSRPSSNNLNLVGRSPRFNEMPAIIKKYLNYQGFPAQPFILSSESNLGKGHNPRDLEFHNQITTNIAQEIQNLMDGVIYLEQRCEGHNMEIQSQLTELLDVEKKIVLINDRANDTVHHLEKIQNKQNDLETRANILVQKLWYYHTPSPGDNAQQDFLALDEVNKEIENTKLFIQKLESQNKTLLKDYKLLSFKHERNATFIQSQYKKLQEAVSKETELVASAKNRIQEMEKQFSQLIFSGSSGLGLK
ncbi:hypothetical protein G9A89_011875 [Geosiphon pyriformis]|nr:hypothetical protein G9A89_011875 [Geosiphon pyriformis]